MNQQLALKIMLAGYSVLLTGAAGSGKTYLLRKFIRSARAKGKKVSVTATTGLAATHLGGTTIHAWSGIGILDELPDGFVEHMSKTRRDIIAKTDVLVIDEISMLHDFRFGMIDTICRLVRETPDVPFGGLQVVLSGDFFQLPPVNRRGALRQGGFVTNSRSWQEMSPVICYLLKHHRQSDRELIDILDAIRAGDLHRHQAELLLERVDERPSIHTKVTSLYTTNVDVNRMNAERLEDIAEDVVSYRQVSTGAQNYVASLQKSVLAPENLQLKLGAFVMAVKNASDRKYVNGSLGTVIDYESGTSYPVVQFTNGNVVNMQPDSWEMRDGDKKRASISQIPLRLAWAITVHKSQGMTLDAALIDLQRAFVPGMGYVALSRVRRLADLYLAGINRMALTVSPEALAIDKDLRQQSELDAIRLSSVVQ